MSSQAVDTHTVLDDLVNQFSDPMSFLRELIQNSIDAGSGEIDIRVEFEPGESPGQEGVMTVFVDDFGEGMDREIIDTKLTRLFSSGKDDDFTKIGRFGIGFVSIFAIAPHAVCVDTGRGGEYWRVIFKKDRSFDLLRLDHAVEGTQIRIFKTVKRAEFEDFQRRAREVVVYWCKHVHVPIWVSGEQVNAPFDLESACKIVHEEEGTRVVMGFVEQAQAPYGFYNRGLTLKEGEESEWPHVHLKIDSRYLEHTLTRDQVLKDRHYHKAHRLLETLATEALPEQLFAQLEQAALAYSQRAQDYRVLCTLLASWARGGGEVRAERRDRRPIVPTLHGAPISLRECAQASKKGALFVAPMGTHLTRWVAQEAVVIPCLQPLSRDELHAFLQTHLLASIPEVSMAWCWPTSAPGVPEDTALTRATMQLLRALGSSCAQVRMMDFHDTQPGCVLRGRLAFGAQSFDEPIPMSRVARVSEAMVMSSRIFGVNINDPKVPALMELAEREPEWASMTLCKMMLLESGLSAKMDEALVSAAVIQREARLGGKP